MRVFASALLALLASGPQLPGAPALAVTLSAQSVPRSCTVVGTATIVAYDPQWPREVAYRFIRSDGSASATQHLAFTGYGAVAQSVRDRWRPRGASPWIALEITSPERIRSRHVAVSARCADRVVTAAR